MEPSRNNHRAWNGTSMQYFTLFELDYVPLYEELMQSIGRADKDDTEIYEGDVVVRSGIARYVVRYQESGLLTGLTPLPFPTVFSPLLIADDIKVLGNIYENPELLETNRG